MLDPEKIAALAKEAVRRRVGRTGRSFQGADRIRTELAAAGQPRQDHGTTIGYPRGVPVRANFNETENPKQAGAVRLAVLCGILEAPRLLPE